MFYEEKYNREEAKKVLSFLFIEKVISEQKSKR